MFGNMKFIYGVDKDVSLHRFAYLWDKINFIFPHNYVLFSIIIFQKLWK